MDHVRQEAGALRSTSDPSRDCGGGITLKALNLMLAGSLLGLLVVLSHALLAASQPEAAVSSAPAAVSQATTQTPPS